MSELDAKLEMEDLEYASHIAGNRAQRRRAIQDVMEDTQAFDLQVDFVSCLLCKSGIKLYYVESRIGRDA